MSRSSQPEERRGMNWRGRFAHLQLTEAPEDTLKEAAARMRAPWRSLGDYLLGCPRYGYSALDRIRPAVLPPLPTITVKVGERVDDVFTLLAAPSIVHDAVDEAFTLRAHQSALALSAAPG